MTKDALVDELEALTAASPTKKSTAELLAFKGHTFETVTTSVVSSNHLQACTTNLRTLLDNISTRVQSKKRSMRMSNNKTENH